MIFIGKLHKFFAFVLACRTIFHLICTNYSVVTTCKPIVTIGVRVMSDIVYLAIYDGISDWEYGYVLAHINSPEFQKAPHRFKVETVGRARGSIKTKGGLTVMPDLTLQELSTSKGKMLILCGADNAAAGGIDDFAEAAKYFIDNHICVAAICGATAALARRGLLDKVPHTSNAKEFLEMTGYAGSENYIQQQLFRQTISLQQVVLNRLLLQRKYLKN